MDGNSLGRLSVATEQRLATVIRQEWGGGLVRTWDDWLPWPGLVGDRLGEALLGAAPGQVVVSDSTTVNLYKCAAAAVDALPERRVIVTDSENFPTDRYVVEGLAREARPHGADGAVRSRRTAHCGDGVRRHRRGRRSRHVLARELRVECGRGHAHDHGSGAPRRRARAVGSVAHGRVVSGRARCLERRPRGRVHLQVRQRRAGSARVPLREPSPATRAAPADLGMVRQRDQFEMGPAYDPEPASHSSSSEPRRRSGWRRWTRG